MHAEEHSVNKNKQKSTSPGKNQQVATSPKGKKAGKPCLPHLLWGTCKWGKKCRLIHSLPEFPRICKKFLENPKSPNCAKNCSLKHLSKKDAQKLAFDLVSTRASLPDFAEFESTSPHSMPHKRRRGDPNTVYHDSSPDRSTPPARDLSERLTNRKRRRSGNFTDFSVCTHTIIFFANYRVGV